MDGSNNVTPPTGLGSYTKAPGLWYDDGNVVFCAGGSKYRVYKGILSAQSRRFGDLLASAEQDNTGETIENNSVRVIMLPDDDEDVFNFFSAIFNQSFYMPPPSKYDLELNVSILRLAQKYEVQYLIRRAVLQLDSFFPSTQGKFRRSIPPESPSVLLPYLGAFTKPLKSLLPVLLLADRSADGAPWLIPRVILTIVRRYPLCFTIAHPYFSLLTYNHQSLIGQGCIIRADQKSRRNSWVGLLPCSVCACKANCASVSMAAQEKNAETIPGEEPIACEVDDLANGRRFCQDCQAAGKVLQAKLAGKFWTKYAEICGFSSWEEVGLVRSAALAALG